MSCTSQRQLHTFLQPNFMFFFIITSIGTPVKGHIKNSSIITKYVFF